MWDGKAVAIYDIYILAITMIWDHDKSYKSIPLK